MNLGVWKRGHFFYFYLHIQVPVLYLCTEYVHTILVNIRTEDTYENPFMGCLHLYSFIRWGREIRDLFLKIISRSPTPRWAVFEFWDSTPVVCGLRLPAASRLVPSAWHRTATQGAPGPPPMFTCLWVCFARWASRTWDEKKRPSLARWNGTLSLGHGPNRPTILAVWQCGGRRGRTEPQRDNNRSHKYCAIGPYRWAFIFQLLKQFLTFCNRNQYLLLAISSSDWPTRLSPRSDQQPDEMANTRLPLLLALCLLILQVSALVCSGAYQLLLRSQSFILTRTSSLIIFPP